MVNENISLDDINDGETMTETQDVSGGEVVRNGSVKLGNGSTEVSTNKLLPMIFKIESLLTCRFTIAQWQGHPVNIF